jgi:hypothetical protein
MHEVVSRDRYISLFKITIVSKHNGPWASEFHLWLEYVILTLQATALLVLFGNDRFKLTSIYLFFELRALLLLDRCCTT